MRQQSPVSNIHFQNIRAILKTEDYDHKNIKRYRGGLVDPIKTDESKKEKILHYFAIFTNDYGEARLYYKPTANISFLKRPRK